MTENEAARPAIQVDDLSVVFDTRYGQITAVDSIHYEIPAHGTLGIVGESGCGKSVAALALMGLIDPPGRITSGTINIDGTRISSLSEKALERVRGNVIAMIFQEPMTALNPVMRVGEQIMEVLRLHKEHSRATAADEATALMEQVGIPDPKRRMRSFPHQLSGGMRQRVMIAMALAGEPKILIADEPTTALDVTIQAQILELVQSLQEKHGTAIQLISHDLGIVSEYSDEIAVMYAGRIVERASASTLFSSPRHPYTQGLLETIPRLGSRPERLPAIEGTVPSLMHLPTGCAFRERCPIAEAECAAIKPPLRAVDI